MLTKILTVAVIRKFFLGALKDNFNSARKCWGNEGNLGTSPKITKNHENLHFLCRAEYPHTSRSLTRPRYVLGTSSLHFRILQKILKRFKKKFMKKYWKFLIENRFQKCWFRKFSKNQDFHDFFRKIGKSEFFRENRKIEKSWIFIDFFEKSKNRKNRKIMIFENFRNQQFWNRFSIKNFQYFFMIFF